MNTAALWKIRVTEPVVLNSKKTQRVYLVLATSSPAALETMRAEQPETVGYPDACFTVEKMTARSACIAILKVDAKKVLTK